MTDYDFVVAGAGHNSLITAAYLAAAGHRCLILDTRPIPGGGAATEEILVPGLGIDTCSTGHTLIQANPLIAADELGLVGTHGLAYVDPDPVAHVRFPDGEHITMWLDQNRTTEEFARFSQRDADAYGRMLAEYEGVKHLFGRSRFNPQGFVPSLPELLQGHPRGGVWTRRLSMSAWQVIRHEFESKHVRAFMLWMAFQTLTSVDAPGSGPLAYSLIYGRQQRSWSIPTGGSGRLIDALVGYLDDHDTTILCERTVTRLIIEDGRCVGVETADGEEHRASVGVVSTIHVKHLIDMAPGELWGDEFAYGVDTYDVGISGFGTYLATTAPPVFPTGDGGQTAVSAGIASWPEDMVAFCRRLVDGAHAPEVPWMLVATPTLVDQSRARNDLHTVKLLTAVGFDLPAGTTWDEEKHRHSARQLEALRRVAAEFTDDTILASLIHSPADIEAWNPHMIRGTFHGGDRSLPFAGANRPAPGWASHRMPIPGLYQTGGTTHPGGSITGAPGRNAAMVILDDLETTIEAVIA